VVIENVEQEILRRLKEIEQVHSVRILFACEAGSRAWGFASPDSDYDVRFIYVRNLEWYLSYNIESKRDVIETAITDDLDIQGWDLKKALYLFTRTNGSLIEWLTSPTVYMKRGLAEPGTYITDILASTISFGANETALCYHYSHMARGNAREYLFKDQVRLKKYLYVIRPLLAVMHIEAGYGIPPVNFLELVHKVAPESILPGITSLLKAKAATNELGLGDPIPEINAFIETELHRQFKGQGRPDMLRGDVLRNRLNWLFRKAVQDA
jgi:predicted nucleotidyltransferase